MNLFDRFVQLYGRLPTERDPDYLELVRMSKYRILPFPDVGPAFKCANCGAGREDGRGYVDFGLQVDWYGVVYLCTRCLQDIAEKVGLFKAYELKILQLQNRLDEKEADRLTIADFQKTLLNTFEEVNRRYVSVSSSGDDSGTSSDDNMATSSDKSSKSTTSGAKQGVVESTTSSGRKNIPQLADLLKPPNK